MFQEGENRPNTVLEYRVALVDFKSHSLKAGLEYHPSCFDDATHEKHLTGGGEFF
jgi:hypothetical protein